MSGADHTGRTSRPEARARRQADAARLVAAARADAGLSAADVAAEAGVSGTLVYEWESPDSGRRVSLGDAMTPSLARHVVARLARSVGMVAVTLPAARGVHDDLAAVARVQRETSEAVTAHLDAIADGVIDRAENAHVRSEIDDAIDALVTLRESLAAVAHEPVVGVRRIGGGR